MEILSYLGRTSPSINNHLFSAFYDPMRIKRQNGSNEMKIGWICLGIFIWSHNVLLGWDPEQICAYMA